MADLTATLPYHDPFDDNQCPDDILMFDENSSLNLAGLPLFTEPHSFHPSIPQSGDDIVYENDPLMDPFVWGMYEHSIGSLQVGPSEIRCETNTEEENLRPQNSEFGNPMQLSIWPVPPVPFSCTCCQVLREITHTNGIHFTKLEIHGRLGMISHAILENWHGADWDAGNHEYQMFDFCKKSIESVKEFLVQYCEKRKQAGYFMLQDPLLIFYEALCVGLNEDKNLDIDEFLQPSPIDSGEWQMNEPETMNQPEAKSNDFRPPKSSMAAQFVRGLVTITDPKMIDNLQSELDETRLRLVVVQSSAFATKAKSTKVAALLSILASKQDFLVQKWEVLDLAGPWSVDDKDDDYDENDGI
ncbi:hypothetical protein F0562_005920 [Nyssa sinensis]|uniref:Uncharacterized protein n=1 Tax=Nyssa sinensis TaxID=561372 RepID=A0A5J5ANA6_9ASTE|nr:hypothetical protein F0562_005920 [Nyssa sinensis]